ncbi:hypothetical protein OO013_18190 [Mangrovivirga sp. M17]|uniref:Uncharacterized protein n=1 Tax=Mangrovivirga halotolerans TaxID=2993936 RepID=A0ABT3RVM2_9BACT|nr:hypothetical protein [Mangrovivirga halotolerans]MCX2745819.1 hypothetical protein [Mangrovivirga halotolerans]
MKLFNLALLCSIIIFISCKSKETPQLTNDQFIDYMPSKPDDMTEEKYRDYMIKLKSTYEDIKSDDSTFTYVDHFNLFGIYMEMNVNDDSVIYHNNKAFELDPYNFASIFTLMYSEYKGSITNYYNQKGYDSLKSVCDSIIANYKAEKMDIEKYAMQNGFDYELLLLLNEIKISDQAHRSGEEMDFEKQNMIDYDNQLLIDSLYQEYGTYIGKSMVGEEFGGVMWAVIQHAYLEYHEKYLPVVHTAVLNRELSEGRLHLLVDRTFKKKYGYQIFGSQGTVTLAPDSIRQRVINKYQVN